MLKLNYLKNFRPEPPPSIDRPIFFLFQAWFHHDRRGTEHACIGHTRSLYPICVSPILVVSTDIYLFRDSWVQPLSVQSLASTGRN